MAVPVWSSNKQSVHALRGAYLYYFSYFIQWPEAKRPHANFNLCAFTKDQNDRFQLYTINGKEISDAQLRINIFENGQLPIDFTDCHVIYITADYVSWLDEHYAGLSKSTLLVTEGIESPKGMIELFVEHNKLRFSINKSALKSRKFKASSKLLRLAKERNNDL